MLNYQTRQEGSASIVTIKGKINFEVTSKLRESIKDILASHQPKILVIDMESVTFVDSSGLGLLVATKSCVDKSNCRLHICSLPAQVKKVFDQTNLTNFFSIFANEQDALRGS